MIRSDEHGMGRSDDRLLMAAMMLVMGFWTFVRALLVGSAAIALENLALRHQLLVLQRSVRRPRLARWDRVFWVWLSRVWVS